MSEIQKLKLVLENGMEFYGTSFGYYGAVSGEVVFNTAMTGYPESLTDASYKGQILVSTYPLIGNYGVPSHAEDENGIPKFFESDSIKISGLIISDYSYEYSHWNAESSLSKWLTDNKVPAIFGIDTRYLTKVLREKGTMLGKIVSVDNSENIEFYHPENDHLVAQVSVDKKIVYGKGKHKIMLIDTGVKNNIIRCLLSYDTTVIRVPWDYDISTDDFDGLFISNGPGDPKRCDVTIENLRRELEGDRPIFGICLGSQLMALAAGADTYKLKYGHRSHNQPAIHVGTKKCYITSQNHGYAVNEKTLPSGWKPLFMNLNDDTCEGIEHESKPFFSTQFHPEASSGPTDTEFLFQEFIDKIERWKSR